MLKIKKSSLALVLIAVLAVGIGTYVQQSGRVLSTLPEFQTTVILPAGRIIDDISFIDHEGQPFTTDNLRGHWSLVFFGFTHCPDICPTTMATLKQVKQQLSARQKWGNYQVVMASVDPKRDTPEQLANYVPFFDPEFIGITGSEDGLTEFARQVGVVFISREQDDPKNYEVDHSASVILINPSGHWVGAIPAPHMLEQMTSDLSLLADSYADDHQSTRVSSSATSTNPKHNTARISRGTTMSIDKAWIRPAPPGAMSMAAYFELNNSTGSDIQIVAATSPQFDEVMIHNTTVIDGLAKMKHLDTLRVPAWGSVSLKPMATHLMLMEPEDPLPAGSLVDLTLIDVGGTEFTAQIEVRSQPD